MKTEHVDLEDLQTAWRYLGNEGAMYPMEMADVAAKMGPERQLLVDDHLIAGASGITREVHQPVRYAGNPVLQGEGDSAAFVLQVLQFAEAPRFRMWYWSILDWHAWGRDQEIRFGNSYAVSADGVHWQRPALNLHQVEGLEDENIVLPYGNMQGVFYEPWERDPEQRFKSMVLVEGRKKGQRQLSIPEGYYLHTSPDGIHWRGDLTRCLIPSLDSYSIPQTGPGDTTQFWWDPLRKKYIGDVKFVLPGKIRCRGIMESDDLVHWTRPHPTFLARRPEDQIYGHNGFVYQGMYIGLRWIYQPQFLPAPHCMDVELDCSRDGKIWTRVGPGQPFMPLNPELDTWDALQLKVAPPLVVDDEIWLYYAAAHGPFPPAVLKGGKSTGLAKLRLDGFVSVNAGEEVGKLETRPLSFTGKRLHLNAAVEPNGEIRVGLARRDGRPLEGFATGACHPVKGDGIDIPVSWEKGPDMGVWSNSEVRIQFELRKAKLYSFWIE